MSFSRGHATVNKRMNQDRTGDRRMEIGDDSISSGLDMSYDEYAEEDIELWEENLKRAQDDLARAVNPKLKRELEDQIAGLTKLLRDNSYKGKPRKSSMRDEASKAAERFRLSRQRLVERLEDDGCPKLAFHINSGFS